MPTQRFDGTTLEQALERACAELGPGCRITGAERIRMGGLGGFFAKERVEIEVEVPDGVGDLTGSDDGAASERADRSGRATAGATPAGSSSPDGPAGRSRPARRSRPAAPTDVLALAEQVSDAEQATSRGARHPGEAAVLTEDRMADRTLDFAESGPPGAGVPSTEGDAFAAVLGRIAGEAGVTPSFSARRWTAGGMEDDIIEPTGAGQPSADDPSTGGPPAGVAALLTTDEPAAWQRTILAMAAPLAAPGPAPTTPAGPVAIQTASAPADPEPVLAHVVPAGPAPAATPTRPPSTEVALLSPSPGVETATAPATVERIEAAPATVVDPSYPAGVVDVEAVDAPAVRVGSGEPALAPLLARMGLPVPYLPARAPATMRDLRPILTEALARLPMPAPLPTAGGNVITVAGRPSEAMAIARAISAQLQLDRRAIVVASTRKIARPAQPPLISPEAAETARRSWRWRESPTVVVVESNLHPFGAAWARDVLTALEPAAAWGVVDATAKIEDVAEWSDAIGGLDALALNRIADTTSPAAILGLGIPVATLDGLTATPAAWADLLATRAAA